MAGDHRGTTAAAGRSACAASGAGNSAKARSSAKSRCEPAGGEAPGTFVCGNEIHLFHGGEHRQFQWIDPYLPVVESADAHGGLRATMPGSVLAVLVKAGDEVAKGAPLVVLEAMKMEQTITAPSAGKVDRVLCEVGDQVREGAELLAWSWVYLEPGEHQLMFGWPMGSGMPDLNFKAQVEAGKVYVFEMRSDLDLAGTMLTTTMEVRGMNPDVASALMTRCCQYVQAKAK